MSTPFHNTVYLDSIKDELANRTVVITGAVTQADEGKALTQDKTAPNSFKLAGDGDRIFGRLEIFETRGVGTMQLNFTERLPKATATVVNVGDTVVGAGAGLVKAGTGAAINPLDNYVVEVAPNYVIVVKYGN